MLYGVSSLARGAVHPFVRMWRSSDPIDAYALNHFTSVAGDAMLAIALADSVFFSLPVGEAKLRVAAYLGLTMLPLALAGPLLVPLLDRAGPRRSSRSPRPQAGLIAIYAAPRFGTLVLFPTALALLVPPKVHAITKNGLTIAYAGRGDGLMQANARLGRLAAVGRHPRGADRVRRALVGRSTGGDLSAAVVYAGSALLTLRLAHLGAPPPRPGLAAAPGAVPELAVPAVGAVGMRAASGFLLFLLAFSLREERCRSTGSRCWRGPACSARSSPTSWRPRVPRTTREEAVVIASVSAACIGARARVRALRPAAADGLHARRRGAPPSSAGSRSRA